MSLPRSMMLPSSPVQPPGLLNLLQDELPVSGNPISTLPVAALSPPYPAHAPKESIKGQLTKSLDFFFNSSLLQKYLSLKTSEEASRLLTQSEGPRVAPGRLTHHAAYIKQYYDPTSKFTFYSNPTQFVQGPASKQWAEPLQTNELFWLDIFQPSDVDLRILALIFKLHPLTLEDIMFDDERREKCEVFDTYLFLCLQTFFPQEDELVETFYYLLLFPTCVLSVRFAPFVHPLNVLIRLTNTEKHMDWAPDWIVYAILDDIMDGFLPVIKALQVDVACIDDFVVILGSREQKDMLARIRGAAKQVAQLMRMLHFKDEVVKSFSNRGAAYVQQATLWYLRDIQDHLVTLHQALQMARENLNNAHNIYLSLVSVELAQRSVMSNKLMNLISVQALMFVPLTFITGLFGMNVNLPGQRTDDTNSSDFDAFYAISSGMLIIVILMVIISWRFGKY